MTAPPTHKKLNPARQLPFSFFRRALTTMPLTLVDQPADSYLAQQISQISGVAQRTQAANNGRTIGQYKVDPAKLASVGLTSRRHRWHR